PVWQTIDRHFRCASAARFWPALHEYANAPCAHGREGSCRIAQRPAAPNKSFFEPEGFFERDLFCFPQASVSCAAKNGCFMSHSVKCVWLTASYLEANACKGVRFGAPANLPVSMLRSSLGEV